MTRQALKRYAAARLGEGSTWLSLAAGLPAAFMMYPTPIFWLALLFAILGAFLPVRLPDRRRRP